MKLRDSFKTYKWLFKQALAENDTALLQHLFLRNTGLELITLVGNASLYTQVKPETAAFIAENMTADVEKKWDRYSIFNGRMLETIYRTCINAQPQAEMVEAFIGSRVPVQKLAEVAVNSITNEADCLAVLDKILEKDARRLGNSDAFAQFLGGENKQRAFDYLVASGYDLHKDNQVLMRTLVQSVEKDFIVHMVKAHGADMEVAINTARLAGHDKVCSKLEDIRREISPDAAPLMSFEEMAREITTLRGTVKDLQQMVTALDAKIQELQSPAKQIDKKFLSTHAKN